MSTPKVYEAIAAVMADIAKEGIAKDRKNDQQGYKFRGIDDVYNALAPILSRHKLTMLPRVLNRDVVERVNQRGTALFYVTVQVEFDIVSGEDGSKHTVTTYGEAMDSGDKATNKAMSAAYKYAAMQAFCIPTEGDNDADATTHEVAPKVVKAPSHHPEGADFWGCPVAGIDSLNANQAKKAGLDDTFELLRHSIDELTTPDETRDWIDANKADIARMPQAWRIILRQEIEENARQKGFGQRKAA